jgi:hypothetical protein
MVLMEGEKVPRISGSHLIFNLIPFHTENEKRHACPELSIMNKFALEKWESAEKFFLWKFLSKGNNISARERTQEELSGSYCQKGNYISAREKTHAKLP